MADDDQMSGKEALAVRNKALRYARKNKDTLGMNAIYTRLALSYVENDQIDSAVKYYERALATHLKSPFLYGWVETMANYGIF